MISNDGLINRESEPLLYLTDILNQNLVLQIYRQDKSIRSTTGFQKVLQTYIYKLHIYSRRTEKEMWLEFKKLDSALLWLRRNYILTPKGRLNILVINGMLKQK